MNNENNTNGKDTEWVDLAEYHLKSVGLDPRLRQNFDDFVGLIPKVIEAGLAEDSRAAMRVSAEALQAIRHTQDISDKEARGEPLTPLDRLTRYYKMSGPRQAAGPTPSLERENDDRPAFEKINEYYKRNKPR